MRCIRRVTQTLCAGALLTTPAMAELTHLWTTEIPVGSSLYAGLRGMRVDATGNSYLTGGTGPSGNVDVITARIDPDGLVAWSKVFNGALDWHDTAADLALAPDGGVLVTGSTPGTSLFADALLLKYDGASGDLIWNSTYNGGSGISDAGLRVAVDAGNNSYLGGQTVGDGGDCLTVKFNSAGVRQWAKKWDGAAFAPYSQEAVRGIAVDSSGNVVIVTDGVMANNHADYQVIKYSAATGAQMWSQNFGLGGDEFPAEMVIDAAGDVFVTGVGLDFNNKYLTVKFSGTDGQVLWSAYDAAGIDDAAAGIWLDGLGGVYITGAVDPDGDHSNFNDNIYTVKRDATTGAQLWTHQYGANCVGCYDVASDVLVDSAGHVLVLGATSSPPYSSDQIVLVLDAGTGVEVNRDIMSGGPTESIGGSFLRLDARENIFVGGNLYDFNSGAVTLSVMKFASLVPAPGDTDGDGDVDLSDLGVVLAAYGACTGDPAFTAAADIDASGCVDLSDLGILLSNFGN